jgi:hypothetical protein
MKRSAQCLWFALVFVAAAFFASAEEQGWVQYPLKFAAPKGDIGYTTLHCEEYTQVCHETRLPKYPLHVVARKREWEPKDPISREAGTPLPRKNALMR